MIKKKIKRAMRISRIVIYKETSVDLKEQFWSFVGAFFGIGIIAFLQSYLMEKSDAVLLIASFGASSVLIYGAIQSPMAQPRNLIGGHVVGAFIGVAVYKLLPDIVWLTAPLAVALSIVVMQITKTLHPPGGATALIAVIGSQKIKMLGFFYIISPALAGAIILLIVALIFNNITAHRKYPTDKRFTKIMQQLFIKN